MMKVKVALSCPTLCTRMDYTVHGIIQARVLEWVAYPFSSGSSQPRNWTGISWIAGGFFTSWATRKAPRKCWPLISCSSAFSKPSLYIWKFLVHVLLKSSLMDFEYYFASVGNEYNCVVVWTFCQSCRWKCRNNFSDFKKCSTYTLESGRVTFILATKEGKCPRENAQGK